MESGHVARDGSPLEVYLALPAGQTPALIHRAVPPGSILELGSGPGRITRELVALGRDVVAVDDSTEMLAAIDYAKTVVGDIYEIDLDEEFAGVVAGSHLINRPVADERRALLSVCRNHVTEDGAVLVERYAPSWAEDPQPSQAMAGPVSIRFEPVSVGTAGFTGRVEYGLDDRVWVQEFSAVNITEESLIDAAADVGLEFVTWLDDLETWAKLRPT